MVVLTSFMNVEASEVLPAEVLFDQGHGQRFLIEDSGPLQLSGLSGIVRGHGANPGSTKNELNDETLRNYKALVISGPFTALSRNEVEAVASFIEKGGRLAAMLHIGPPLAGLLARLGIVHSNAVLHERQNVIDTDINFRVADLTPDPLFTGINQFSIYGAWALEPTAPATSIARTSASAWVDLDGDKILSKGDVVSSFTLLARGTYGAGSYVIFGDDAIFQNRFLDEDNRKLASNLALWLIGR
ncbi:MAG: DUF4350 domain-containing protein [Deltaproteobacteria bacterium]|nr:DUF4350 domain-containing protein [Deltaproteobacteria bacterium]